MTRRAFCFVVLLLAVGAALAQGQRFVTGPQSVEQGEPAVFVLEWPSDTSVAVAAGSDRRSAFFSVSSTEEGRVLSAECFRLSEDRWACMAGIPSTLPAGEYEIYATLTDARGHSELVRKLAVESREFIAETIPLNESLTEMRAEPDPRKAEEARELRELVGRFHPEAVYHSGPFVVPVTDGIRTSHFGDRRTYRYVDGASANAVHFGIDIASPTGTPVRAGGAGRVVMVANRVISGRTVVIEHLPGVYGLHYHLHEARVEVGDVVDAEDVIGTVGATGLATGPHLHWEVRVSRIPVEPDVLLSEGLIDTDTFSRNIGENEPTPQ